MSSYPPVLPRCRLLQSSSILIPGDTVWRRCKAGRLAILNDAAVYFAALREALLLATRQVYIIGWDIHSLTRFVGPSGQADDGLSAGARRVSESAPESEARSADQCPDLGFPGPLCRGAGVEFSRQIHVGRVGPALLLFRFQPSVRLRAAPEDRRHRWCACLRRRSRPHDPALGHQRARSPSSAADRSRRQALSAVSRRAVHGGRRSSRPL